MYGGAKAPTVPAFPLTEPKVYAYSESSRLEKATATKADTFLQAGRYATKRLGLDNAQDIFNTDRVEGSMLQSLGRKAAKKPAQDVSVQTLALLEHITVHAKDPLDKVLAGQMVVCTYARLRAGDSINGIQAEPYLDVDEEGIGFAEAVASMTKTLQGDKRKIKLEQACPAQSGDPGEFWAREWINARDALGLCATDDGFLLPLTVRAVKRTLTPVASAGQVNVASGHF